MSKTQPSTIERNLYDTAEDAFTSEGGGSVPAERPERERVVAEHSARRDGLRYEYRGYRYDVLSDAIRYTTLLRSRADPSAATTAVDEPVGGSATVTPSNVPR